MRGTCSSGGRGGAGLLVRLEPWFSHVCRVVVEACRIRVVNVLVVGLIVRRLVSVIPCILAVVERSASFACFRCEPMCRCAWAFSFGSPSITGNVTVVLSSFHIHYGLRFRVR